MYGEMKILIVASVMIVLLATAIAHSPSIQSVYSQGPALNQQQDENNLAFKSFNVTLDGIVYLIRYNTISQIMLEKYKVLFPTRIHLSLSQQLLQQKMENSQSYYPEIS
jgi:hypothetical protein